MTSGYNPLRWNCEVSGCFNIKRRPKIEVFYECFPGRINFGDVDGIVELKGRFCLLEWKGDGGAVRLAQHLTYQAFTSMSGNVVFVVKGNAETMAVEHYEVYWNGKKHAPKVANLTELKDRISSWAHHVKTIKKAA